MLSKNSTKTLTWIVFSSLVVGFAFWQVKILATENLQPGDTPTTPPTRTRHAIRSGNPPASQNPTATFTARLAKGLTEREIGWIIEDFLTAKLNLVVRAGTADEYIAQRLTQDRWYLRALVEAWSLTPEQSSQASAKLSELFDQAKAEFIKETSAPKSFEVDGKWYTLMTSEPMNRFIETSRRLQDPEGKFLPTNLWMNSPAAVIFSEAPQLDKLSDKISFLARFLPTPNPSIDETITHAPSQEEGVLPALRKLHPAQLKLLLFIDTELAKKVESALAITP